MVKSVSFDKQLISVAEMMSVVLLRKSVSAGHSTSATGKKN